MILTKHKNILLSIIQESGLEPNLFSANDEVIDQEENFVIRLRDSQILFAVEPYSTFDSFSAYHSIFSPDFPMSESTYVESISKLAERFKRWLEGVVKPYLDDIGTPNLWQILENNRSQTKSELGTPDDFEFFSDEEKIRIRLSLNDFKLLIVKNFNPKKEVLESVNARLQYLSDAVDKHNKFDWKGISINTVIALTIALSLNPHQANQLFQLFKHVFSNIIYLLP